MREEKIIFYNCFTSNFSNNPHMNGEYVLGLLKKEFKK